MPLNPSTVDHCSAARDAADPDALDAMAAAWTTRTHNGLDAAGQAELQAWLDADTRHAAAYLDMAARFGRLRQVPAKDVAALKRGLKDNTRAARQPWRRPFGALWVLVPQMAMAVLVVAVVGAGWVGWESWRKQPTFVQSYASERGQQLLVTLPDDAASGSKLELDTATRLDARLYRDRREVRLKNGQALFTVRADTERPFHVRAGRLHITVVGTRFSVRHTATGLDAGQTVVSVEEGHVRVTREPGEADTDEGKVVNEPPVDLTAGQMLVGDNQGRMGPVTSVAPSVIASWRSGRISFEHNTLAQALAEFERYGDTGVVIRDPAVGQLPVGGSYGVRQVRLFAETLPQVLPVRLVPQGNVTEIVAR